MEMIKKTTILFPPQLHEHLLQVARRQGVSLGQLVRKACELAYGSVSPDDRLAAVDELASLSLPVSDVATMKLEMGMGMRVDETIEYGQRAVQR